MAKDENQEFEWEIRLGTRGMVSSPLPKCGYTDRELTNLKKAGYKLYYRGRLYQDKKADALQSEE